MSGASLMLKLLKSKWSPKTIETREAITSNWRRYWKDVRLADIGFRDVEERVIFLFDAGYSANTMRTEMCWLSRVYNWSIKGGAKLTNPVRIAENIPRAPDKVERWFSDQELALMRANTTHEHWRPIKLALCTGMRRKEMFQCQKSWVKIRERRIVLPKTKSKKVQAVVLGPEAMQIVLELMALNPASPYLFGSERYPDQPIDDASWMRLHWRPLLKKCRIEGATFHTLRHTFVAKLIEANVHPEIIQKLARHASYLTTKRYAHIAAGAEDRALAQLLVAV